MDKLPYEMILRFFPNTNTPLMYYGIRKEFYPKWEGFTKIERGDLPTEEDVFNFYQKFYIKPLELEGVEEKDKNLYLLTALLIGKKATKKLIANNITGDYRFFLVLEVFETINYRFRRGMVRLEDYISLNNKAIHLYYYVLRESL